MIIYQLASDKNKCRIPKILPTLVIFSTVICTRQALLTHFDQIYVYLKLNFQTNKNVNRKLSQKLFVFQLESQILKHGNISYQLYLPVNRESLLVVCSNLYQSTLIKCASLLLCFYYFFNNIFHYVGNQRINAHVDLIKGFVGENQTRTICKLIELLR